MSEPEKLSVEAALDELRSHAVFRSLVPMEAGIGWPVPVRRKGDMFLSIPIFGLQQSRGEQSATIFPPFALITISWPRRVIVEYVNLRWKKLWDEKEMETPAGNFPHQAIAGLKVGEYKEKRSRLLQLCGTLLDESMDDSQRDEFSKLLGLLMEPSLLFYYRQLFEKFYGFFIPR